jgi:hypothetical protein
MTPSPPTAAAAAAAVCVCDYDVVARVAFAPCLVSILLNFPPLTAAAADGCCCVDCFTLMLEAFDQWPHFPPQSIEREKGGEEREN